MSSLSSRRFYRVNSPTSSTSSKSPSCSHKSDFNRFMIARRSKRKRNVISDKLMRLIVAVFGNRHRRCADRPGDLLVTRCDRCEFVPWWLHTRTRDDHRQVIAEESDSKVSTMKKQDCFGFPPVELNLALPFGRKEPSAKATLSRVFSWIDLPSGGLDKPTVVDGNNSAGTFLVRYEPREEGTHELHVTYEDEHIQGSPFRIFVDHIQSGNVTAYGAGLSHGVAGEACSFLVYARGVGPGDLSVAVEGPARVVIACRDNNDGTVTVTYTPPAVGEFSISVRFADKHIKGSPFTTKITGDSRKRSDHPAEHLSQVFLNVQEKNAKNFSAKVIGPSGVEVPCQVQELPDGQLGVALTPNESGEHSFTIRRKDDDAIGSPFKIQVFDRQLGDESRVDGIALKEGTESMVICLLRQDADEHLIYTPLDRIAQYDNHQPSSEVVNRTGTDHPTDYTDLCRSANTKAKTMVKRTDSRQEETDLERIQDAFPSDNLRLHDADPLSPRKGLLRSKSLAASRLHRALSGKSHHKTDAGHNSQPDDATGGGCARRKLDSSLGDNCVHRCFIMDGPVVFAMGVQSQDRHLFLFNDLLLIAKSRSSGNYKLKEKVRVSEMWLSKSSLEDVCEPSKSPMTSFVLGWPTTNVVATFSTPQAKELWFERLQLSINKTKEKEGKSNTTIQISFWDQTAGEEKYTLVKVGCRDTTITAIKSAITDLKCEGEVSDYQLWVKTSKEDTPYPLIGHEFPFAIKMNFVRDLLYRSNLDLQNFNNIAADNKCIFILRKNGNLLENAKKMKKPRKAAINWPFKRMMVKAETSVDSGIVNSEPSTPTKGKLFGQHLDLLCTGQSLPNPIINMLKMLFDKGPFTVGIFRKPANARVCKEFRAKLESDPDADISQVPVIVISSVFKEFLRSLPDCLLQSQLYSKWIDAIATENNQECRSKIAMLLQQLPPANLLLFRHFLCTLWYIAQRSSINKMCSVNLGVCVGQSLLSPNGFASPDHLPSTQRCEEMSKAVPKLIAYLIDHCPDLLGESTLNLFGSPPEKDGSRQDSGAEESDSLNSLPDHGVGSNASSGSGNRRDDSSIDSLERALMDDSHVGISNGGHSPNNAPSTFGNKMSLSNLSRDSGLTLSDTQLYTPEDEESESSDNSGGHRKSSPLAYSYLAKSVPHLDMTGLDTGINVTFSYGRSAGVSIDGSCHDHVRKRRHQGLMVNDFAHYLNRQDRAVLGHHPASNMTHYNRAHTYNRSALSQSHLNHNEHLAIQYSKSYSYGINDDVVDGRNPKTSVNANHHHREYRYRRPPLSAVLGGASSGPTSSFVDNYLKRSNSEESLARKYDDVVEVVGSYTHMSLPFQQVPAWNYDQKQLKSVQYNSNNNINNINNSNSNINLNLAQPARRIHHNAHANDCGVGSCGVTARTNHKPSHQIVNGERVSSICSSSSETNSQRSSISKNSNLSKQSSTSLRNNPLGIQPPTYQQAMSRKEMLARAQNGQGGQLPLRKTSSASTSSANSNQIYEESVRIYHEDIQSNNSVTHRAVPVRVKTIDSDTSDVENEPNVGVNQHKQVQRVVSEGTALKPGPRVVRISAQNHSHFCHQQQVSVLQRSAKDFIEEEWKKEIPCSVARLRTMFSSGINSKQNTPNITIRQNARPVSVLIENNNAASRTTSSIQESSSSVTANGHCSAFKTMPSAKQQQLQQQRKTSDRELAGRVGRETGPCVTVVHVSSSGQTDCHNLNGTKSVITVHRIDDSGENSSEEESYV